MVSQRAYLLAVLGQHLRGQPSTLFEGDHPEHPDVQLVR